jgi:hypothetical protein
LEGIQAVIDNKDLRRALPENFFKKSVVEKVALTWKDRMLGLRESFTNIFTFKKEKVGSNLKSQNITEQIKKPTLENTPTHELLSIDKKLILETIKKVESREFFETYLKQTKYPNIFKELIADLPNSKTVKETKTILYLKWLIDWMD